MRDPTLTLEQIYATLTSSWGHRPQVEAYLRHIEQQLAEQRHQQQRVPSPAVQRLRLLAAAQRAEIRACAQNDETIRIKTAQSSDRAVLIRQLSDVIM